MSSATYAGLPVGTWIRERGAVVTDGEPGSPRDMADTDPATGAHRVDGAADPALVDALALIDALARLQLAVRRLGGSLRLGPVSADLHRLLVLTGLDSVLRPPEEPPTGDTRARGDGQPPLAP